MIKQNGWIGTDDKKTAIKNVGNGCIIIDSDQIGERVQIVVEIEKLKEILNELKTEVD